MKRFLAIYIGTASGYEKSQWNKIDGEKRKELEASGMKAWSEWGLANEAAIVDSAALSGRRNARPHTELQISRTAWSGT
jgi:hypothetical protein